MIHIASEIVALVGLTFYFNQKNNKLLRHIENLAQKIEEQEDLLQKHETVIKKMLEFINDQNQKNTITTPVLTKHLETTKIRKKPPVKEVHTNPPLKVPTPSKPETKVSFNEQIFKTPIEQESSEESSEESDLDAELAEELEELEIEEEINVTDLKKRT